MSADTPDPDDLASLYREDLGRRVAAECRRFARDRRDTGDGEWQDCDDTPAETPPVCPDPPCEGDTLDAPLGRLSVMELDNLGIVVSAAEAEQLADSAERPRLPAMQLARAVELGVVTPREEFATLARASTQLGGVITRDPAKAIEQLVASIEANAGRLPPSPRVRAQAELDRSTAARLDALALPWWRFRARAKLLEQAERHRLEAAALVQMAENIERGEVPE
jgi:hypothetical protein